MNSAVDFGYPWALAWGHLLVAAAGAAVAWLMRRRRWLCGALALVAVWALSAWVMMYFVLGINSRGALPTANFLRGSAGRVLDMGAGTGRSALMVLEERPGTTLVALDEFGHSFDHHFGGRGASKLRANLQAAGVESRVTIQQGDMRQMPFEAASFDGIISAYAIDHLNRKGVEAAFAEARRVLKPGGEFLLMVTHKDAFMTYTVGPLLLHSRFPNAAAWIAGLEHAGFRVVEHGAQPITHYFVAR